jgi:glutamyl-tRNA synthetase
MKITRFAPSPTGYLHIGGLRTALLNYLWAKKDGGKFLLRIEDTDRNRHNEDAVNAILEAFEWVGLKSDDEIVYQSQRGEIYQKYINQLLEEGKAYKCYMTKEELNELRESQIAKKERPRYDNRYRDFNGTPPVGVKPVIRIKTPLTGKIKFYDGIKGDMTFNVEDNLDDFIIARADGTPTYNFVVAIDDALMGINEVIRGDDHLSNTPKQIVVYNALNFPLPKFYHLPMIHNEQGSKLSKRDGATDVMEYKKQGYLPEPLLNFLLRLGWSYGDKETFTFQEMLLLFNPKNISRSASIYNLDKLKWLNSNYIKKMKNSILREFIKIPQIHDSELLLTIIKERATTLVNVQKDVFKIANRPVNYDEKALKKHFKEINIRLLTLFLETLQKTEINCKDAFDLVLLEQGAKMPKLAQPIRIALVGTSQSPSVYQVMESIGQNEVLFRIKKLLKL